MHTSNEPWAVKFGMQGQTGLYPIGMNPNDEYMWYIYEDRKDDKTHYYAISEL